MNSLILPMFSPHDSDRWCSYLTVVKESCSIFLTLENESNTVSGFFRLYKVLWISIAVALLGQCSHINASLGDFGQKEITPCFFACSKSFEIAPFNTSPSTFFPPKGNKLWEVRWRGSILINILVRDSLSYLGRGCLITSDVICSSKVPISLLFV